MQARETSRKDNSGELLSREIVGSESNTVYLNKNTPQRRPLSEHHTKRIKKSGIHNKISSLCHPNYDVCWQSIPSRHKYEVGEKWRLCPVKGETRKSRLSNDDHLICPGCGGQIRLKGTIQSGRESVTIYNCVCCGKEFVGQELTRDKGDLS